MAYGGAKKGTKHKSHKKWRTISKELYIKAIHESGGIVSFAARRLGCTPVAIYKAKERFPEVAQALIDAREEMTDVAEGKLYEQIRAGNMTAIIFYLKTQAKHRGYIEKLNIAHSLDPASLSDEELEAVARDIGLQPSRLN